MRLGDANLVQVAGPRPLFRHRCEVDAAHPDGFRPLARLPEAAGGQLRKVSLDEALLVSREPQEDLVRVDDALNGAGEFDPRKARVVELRYFGGLSVEETDSGKGLPSRDNRLFLPAHSVRHAE